MSGQPIPTAEERQTAWDADNPAPRPAPSIGRIVQFVDERGHPHAALITGVVVTAGLMDAVSLTVFPDPSTLLGKMPQPFAYGPLPHDDDLRVSGQPYWRWPPHVPPK